MKLHLLRGLAAGEGKTRVYTSCADCKVCTEMRVAESSQDILERKWWTSPLRLSYKKTAAFILGSLSPSLLESPPREATGQGVMQPWAEVHRAKDRGHQTE